MFNKLIASFLFVFLLAGAVNVSAQSKTNRPKRILYVMRKEFKDRPYDELAKKHLDSLGYEVTFADAADPVSVAKGYDMIIISATVSARAFGGKYANVALPILTWENDIQDDMRYTGRYKGVDFGKVPKEHYIWLVNAPHQMSAGLPAGTAVAYNDDMSIGWGKPGLGASIIATLPGQPEKAIIYCYEKGATMDYDFLAPEKRAMFFLDNRNFGLLTKDGVALFDAAVAWTIKKN